MKLSNQAVLSCVLYHSVLLSYKSATGGGLVMGFTPPFSSSAVLPSASFSNKQSKQRHNSIAKRNDAPTRNPLISKDRPTSSFSTSLKMTQKDEEVPENNSKNNNSSNTGDKEETPLDKALRKARARKEIERLTSGPDGIYDAESSLKKVKGISPGLPADSVEYVEDKKYYELESQMLQAVQKGDFEQASEKRDEIDRMHVDDCGFVLQANTKFYKAFSEKNLEEMEKIWCASDASAVQCIHPSHQPIIGYKHVIESWKSMFNSKDETFQMNTMEPTNLRLSVKGATAWLTCDEEVYKPKFVRGKGKTKELVKKMLATNIFRKVDGKW